MYPPQLAPNDPNLITQAALNPRSQVLMRFQKLTEHSKPVFWVRIRTDFGQLDPDPDAEAKTTQKNKKV